MKINKIPEIQNIGSFTNFVDKSFIYGKCNVIYALNGYGKTTLTSIIRSLKENNPNIILGRKNLKELNDNNVKAIIETADNKNYLYFNGYWRVGGQKVSNKNPEIIIFDDEFISNNIFAERFEIDHKKALYRIIFGSVGIKLSKDLTKLREKKKELSVDISTLENKLTPKYFEKEEYLVLDETKFDLSKIKSDIKKVEKTITNSKNLSKITKKQGLTNLQYIEINNNQLFSLLKRKVNSEAHIKAKSEIDKFKAEYFKNASELEQFIEIGTNNYKSHCPFCHKILDDEVLLETYKSFFDKSYDDFKKEIEEKIRTFGSANLQVTINDIASKIVRNFEIYNEWKEMFLIQNSLSELKLPNEILTLKSKVDKINTDKLLNLNLEPNTSILSQFKKSKISLNCLIRKYNKQIQLINWRYAKKQVTLPDGC